MYRSNETMQLDIMLNSNRCCNFSFYQEKEEEELAINVVENLFSFPTAPWGIAEVMLKGRLCHSFSQRASWRGSAREVSNEMHSGMYWGPHTNAFHLRGALTFQSTKSSANLSSQYLDEVGTVGEVGKGTHLSLQTSWW